MEIRSGAAAVSTPEVPALDGAARAARVPADSNESVGCESDLIGEITEALRRFSRLAVSGQSGVVTAAGAARFAGSVEELSRTVEHLQVVAAGRLEQVRDEAEAAGEADWWVTPEGKRQSEYRNTADYLRDVVRVNRPEAARRLKLAAQVLPSSGLAGQPVPPACEELAVAMAGGQVSAQAAVTTQMALGKAKAAGAGPETVEAMETSLTEVAAERDPQFVAVAAARWLNHIDQDGAEPSEAELRHRQGVFLRGKRGGLHRLEILATDDQYEHLITTMNAAANPRARGCTPDNRTTSAESGTTNSSGTTKSRKTAGDQNSSSVSNPNPSSGGDPSGSGAGDPSSSADNQSSGGGSVPAAGTERGVEAGTGGSASANHGDGNETSGGEPGGESGAGGGVAGPVPAAAVDRRAVAQKRLDGLVAACDIALATNGLPATGGHRPQIMAVIDYQELLTQLNDAADHDHDTGDGGHAGSAVGAGTGRVFQHGNGAGAGAGGTGSYMFGGPVHAGNIRQLACDAEIIPVVLAGNGQILDLGTGRRLFPPHLRRALVARDGGCAFPGCTMPAPWTEAHHIKYATDDGETSTDNGCLLCSFHHHLIHKEKWTITVAHGVPWFTPPAYVDPDRQPIRNHFFNRKPHHQTPQQTHIEYANTG